MCLMNVHQICSLPENIQNYQWGYTYSEVEKHRYSCSFRHTASITKLIPLTISELRAASHHLTAEVWPQLHPSFLCKQLPWNSAHYLY